LKEHIGRILCLDRAQPTTSPPWNGPTPFLGILSTVLKEIQLLNVYDKISELYSMYIDVCVEKVRCS